MGRILSELEYGEIRQLLVFNKADLLDEDDLAERLARRDAIAISATRSTGIPALLERIDEVLPPGVRMDRGPSRTAH